MGRDLSGVSMILPIEEKHQARLAGSVGAKYEEHLASFELELLNLGILSRKIEIEWHAFFGLEGSLPRGESPDQREIIAPVHRPGLNIARRSFMSKSR